MSKIAVFYFAQGEAGWASHKPSGLPVAAYASHHLSCLSARLKSVGHVPYLVDGRSFASQSQFESVARHLEFDAALAWVMPCSRQIAAEGIDALRKVGKTQPIAAAGPSISAVGERIAGESCDILGELDESFPAWVARVDAGDAKIPGIIDDGMKPTISVDSLPEIDRGHFNVEVEKACVPLHLLPPPIYTLTVGRGCPACHDATLMGVGWRCRRCLPEDGSTPYTFRARDPHKWVDDVQRLTTSHGTGGVGTIVLHDSHLVGLDWLSAMAADWQDMVRRVRLFMPLDPLAILADPAIVRELARCGLTWAHFDLGHGADRLRRVLGVPFAGEEARAAADVLHRNRVNLSIRVTCGIPGETDADVDASERLVREMGAAKVDARVWIPCPGTTLWDDANRRALLSNEGLPIDDLPRPWIKGVDYARVLRRLRNWASAYEAKITDLPPEQWQREPAPAARKTSATQSTPDPVVEVRPAPHVPTTKPTNAPSIPARDDVDAVLAALDAVRNKSASTRPKVTVITTVHEPYLAYAKEALASIEEQTLREDHLIEHIVIDNGTTRADAREYFDYKDSAEFKNWRPRVIRYPNNVNNVAATWNAALSVARGEYVCFLDADNRKCKEFLKRLISVMDKDPLVDVAHCRSWIVDSRGNRTGKRGKSKADFTLGEELEGNWVDSGEMVVRRSTLARVGFLDERMRACEDWDLVVRLKSAGCRFVFVDEPLCEYRSHSENRMHTSSALGAGACAELIREKANHRQTWDVRVVAPPRGELTASQNQVISGIMDALRAVEWVKIIDDDGGPSFACDVVLVLAPFRLADRDVEALFRRVDNHGGPRRPQIVTLHMEDPQAVIANGRLLGRADWIVANDYSAMRHYKTKLSEAGLIERAKRVLCWNSLGASRKYLDTLSGIGDVPRDVDVLVLGYAYPSRQAIVKAFAKDAPTNWRVVCVGDEWANAMRAFPRVECVATQGEEETARWCARARVILVTHRRQQDIGGFPLFAPESVHRGFLEAAAGAAVLVDDVRTFGASGVPFTRYTDGRDAARKAFALLKNLEDLARRAALGAELCRGELSMTSRVRAIMNAIRDEQYNVVIA